MHLLEMEIKHRCNQALEMGFGFYGLAKLFAQDWEGDVTIVMNASLAQVRRLILAIWSRRERSVYNGVSGRSDAPSSPVSAVVFDVRGPAHYGV